MKILICLFLLFIFTVKSLVIFSQDLISIRLSKSDQKQGIISKYQRSEMESYFELILFKSGKFKYHSVENIIGTKYSEGLWTIKNKLLVINSTIGNETLPIKVSYSDDTLNVPKIKVQSVYNTKGEMLEDAMLTINNDSCLCSPLMDWCLHPHKKIDSLKVIIGDTGCSSAWVNIACKNYKQLQITVLSDINFREYLGFTNRKYRVSKTGLYELENK